MGNIGVKFIKDAQKEAFGPKATIIKKLIKSLSGYEPARSHKTVHASDITKPKFCARQTALLDQTGLKKKDEYISTPLRVTFDVGNALSDLFREQWASGWCYGDWRCIRCNQQRTFCLKPGPEGCVNGWLSHAWRYEEMNFVSKEYEVSGSLDAVLDLGAPKLFVAEVKIMTPVDFEKLITPLPEHRLRTALYMKLIEDSPSVYAEKINLQQAKVLYISRAWGKQHPEYNEILPFKEFDVKRDDASLGTYLDKALLVKHFRKKGLMPAGVCGSSIEQTAKQCPVLAQCFSGKYPVSI